jgi:HD-GYP domain-containing protein (c-di-GMP phosphodiesterase class II)
MFTSDMKEKMLEDRAKDVVNNLAIVIKTSQLHDVNNVAVVNAIHKFLEILNPLVSAEEVTLQLVGEFFHFNGSRVRYTLEYSSNFDFIIEEFKKINLGTIIFEGTLTEDMIKVLISSIKASEQSDIPFETLCDELGKVPHIKVEELKEIKEDKDYRNKKKQIKKTYSNAVSITKGVLSKADSGETINFRKSKRVIASITDQILEDESRSILVGMTTLKDYDDYTYHHSVNVSILAIAFGHKLGLPKIQLAELGLAALFHDLGKIKIPLEILNKPSAFSDSDWKIMRQHPIWGTVTILKIKGINESSMNLAIPAFEHHLNYDISGYPDLKKKMPLDLYSKIIAISDQYDAMTSSRVYSRNAMAPDKALGLLTEASGKRIDPYLIKVFIQMIGIYPIGCLAMLDTDELGIVFENNQIPEYSDRPNVLIIADSSGPKTEKTIVNLMEKDEEGVYTRSIVKTLDPNQYGVNLAEYLL